MQPDEKRIQEEQGKKVEDRRACQLSRAQLHFRDRNRKVTFLYWSFKRQGDLSFPKNTLVPLRTFFPPTSPSTTLNNTSFSSSSHDSFPKRSEMRKGEEKEASEIREGRVGGQRQSASSPRPQLSAEAGVLAKLNNVYARRRIEIV